MATNAWKHTYILGAKIFDSFQKMVRLSLRIGVNCFTQIVIWVLYALPFEWSLKEFNYFITTISQKNWHKRINICMTSLMNSLSYNFSIHLYWLIINQNRFWWHFADNLKNEMRTRVTISILGMIMVWRSRCCRKSCVNASTAVL